jgi:hypothetical protein
MDGAAAVWQEAFEAEVLGGALFGRLAELEADEDRRATLAVLQRLEDATRELLRPVLQRLAVPTDGEDEAASRGAAFATAAADRPWEELLGSLEPNTAKYAQLYERLRPLVDDEDRAVVEALVRHERALCEFATRELAGRPDALEPILTLPHVAAHR